MNKEDFRVLKAWFEKCKALRSANLQKVKAGDLFIVKTNWDSFCFQNSKEKLFATERKSFPNYYYEIGEKGFLNHDELSSLFFNMRRDKDLRQIVVSSI